MVMEAPPSPQSVGREFVRQYYTLLNKAPMHLHRFYNNQSSFLHGGLDPGDRELHSVTGQKAIHQKIQQMNFSDCHAKILQVDAQGTLQCSVVVMVSGELSVGGGPMRPFSQVFVLAMQSPKKYYVQNDMFRYQDIQYEECDTESRSEPEIEFNNQDHQQAITDVPAISQQPIPFFANAPMQPAIPPVPIHHNQAAMNVMPPQGVPAVNGSIHPEEMNILPGQGPQHVANEPAIGNALNNIQPGLVPSHLNVVAPVEETEPPTEEPVEEPVINSFEETEPEIEQEIVPEPVANEPKTYANLLKSGTTSGYGSSQQVQPTGFTSQPGPRSISPVQNNNGGQGMNQRNGNRNPRMNMPRVPRQDSRGPGRNSTGEEEDRRPRQNMFGDVNQLFLGNLPQVATEEELREIFCQFGTILDLRVHSKAANKNTLPGGRAPPNYGFITYETQYCVQKCLEAKPIFYPKDDKNGTQLNVEEKKNKERPSFGGNRPNDNNRPRDNNQRRGMGPGPNRNNGNGGGSAGGPGGANRNNNYNRPQNRGNGPSTYNVRR